MKTVRPGADDYNRYTAACQILPVLQALVHGREHVVASVFRQKKQGAIRMADNANIRYGAAVVARESCHELPGDALTQEDFRAI